MFQVLYEEMLPDAFAEHEIAHLGGIDYRDGLLCWTMLDRIFCADWDGEYDLQNMRTAVSSGSAAHVCSGQSPCNINMYFLHCLPIKFRPLGNNATVKNIC